MRHHRAIAYISILLAALTLSAGKVCASSQGVHIANTPHNLSKSGGGGQHNIAASDEERICVFCHTPHHANIDGPLWSRKSNISIYILYDSPTIKATPEQPQGVSRLCLSCHDGTVAMGLLVGEHQVSSLGAMPAPDINSPSSNFGTDLSKSHPISMLYPTDPELYDKSTLEFKGIKLGYDSYVECISCHDPHNNQYGNFLVQDTSTRHDALCVQCHKKNGWTLADTTHRTGGARYGADVVSQVGSDGCANCHRPHFAQRGEHLLKQPQGAIGEETNCLGSCHTGASYNSGAGTTVAGDFSLPYKHPIQTYQGLHVENETLPVSSDKKHVQCVDCHNPHQAGYEGSPLGSPTPSVPPASVAPAVNGPLRGVRGVTKTAIPVPGDGIARYEYEVCFRCHAGGAATDFKSPSTQRPIRVFSSYDQSQRFAMGALSFHPVANPTVGRTGRSLVEQYQTTQFQIYCSDCHANHGSTEQFILRAQNGQLFPSGVVQYPLCFRCHDETYLLGSSTSPALGLHKLHVTSKSVPCSACHDPHGVPARPGATGDNTAHLINFDTRYAGNSTLYSAAGRSCTVAGTCHGTGAGAKSYPSN